MKELDKNHFNFKDRAGEKFTTLENYSVTITKYKSYHNCDIIYEDGVVLEQVSLSRLRQGKVFKPKNRVGEKYISNEGFEYEIIDYKGWDKCTILFNNEEVRENLSYGQVKNGKVKNYIFAQIYGIGYIGKGDYNTYFKVGDAFVYNRWLHILKRCYDEKALKIMLTYKGCSVDKRWHNFQNFAKWFEDNYNHEIMGGWELDKDILVKGNKIYSPDTCCFVPKEVNTVFTKRQSKRGDYPIGVIKKSNRFQSIICINNKTVNLGSFLKPEEAFQAYKKAKEEYIKELGNKYLGQITEKCYKALINYKVEITD